MNTDTPMTDALTRGQRVSPIQYTELLDLARRLERDRAELIAALSSLMLDDIPLGGSILAAEHEQRWKDARATLARIRGSEDASRVRS